MLFTADLQFLLMLLLFSFCLLGHKFATLSHSS